MARFRLYAQKNCTKMLFTTEFQRWGANCESIEKFMLHYEKKVIAGLEQAREKHTIEKESFWYRIWTAPNCANSTIWGSSAPQLFLIQKSRNLWIFVVLYRYKLAHFTFFFFFILIKSSEHRCWQTVQRGVKKLYILRRNVVKSIKNRFPVSLIFLFTAPLQFSSFPICFWAFRGFVSAVCDNFGGG